MASLLSGIHLLLLLSVASSLNYNIQTDAAEWTGVCTTGTK